MKISVMYLLAIYLVFSIVYMKAKVQNQSQKNKRYFLLQTQIVSMTWLNQLQK